MKKGCEIKEVRESACEYGFMYFTKAQYNNTWRFHDRVFTNEKYTEKLHMNSYKINTTLEYHNI